MATMVGPSVVKSFRVKSPIMIPVSGDFRVRSFRVLLRASRVVSAYSRNDRAATLRYLDELFAYMVSNFTTPTRTAAYAALTGDRRIIDENAFPLVVSQIVLCHVRLDMSGVPSFTEWSQMVEKSVLP